MPFSLTFLILTLLLAIGSAYGTRLYIHDAPDFLLRNAKADLLCYLLSYAGLVSLLPEAITLFAPEVMAPQVIAGTLWERLDYLTYVLLSVAAGINLMRRWLMIRYQKSQSRDIAASAEN